MTAISIEVDSIQQNPAGEKRRISEAEFTAIASACIKLLTELGPLGKRVEVLKVAPWHGYNRPNIFDIKAVLSMPGDDLAKAEAKRTFEHLSPPGPSQNAWDLNALAARIVSDMKREIYNAAKRRICDLKHISRAWENLLPESESA